MKKLANNSDLGILIFRVAVGGAMALAHGMGKMPPPEQLVQGVGALGFPLPILFAWLASLSEFAGALFIVIGLYTRYAAFFVGFTMSVAFFVVHGADAFAKKELAFLYLASFLLLIFTGAGKFSLDRILRKK